MLRRLRAWLLSRTDVSSQGCDVGEWDIVLVGQSQTEWWFAEVTGARPAQCQRWCWDHSTEEQLFHGTRVLCAPVILQSRELLAGDEAFADRKLEEVEQRFGHGPCTYCSPKSGEAASYAYPEELPPTAHLEGTGKWQFMFLLEGHKGSLKHCGTKRLAPRGSVGIMGVLARQFVEKEKGWMFYPAHHMPDGTPLPSPSYETKAKKAPEMVRRQRSQSSQTDIDLPEISGSGFPEVLLPAPDMAAPAPETSAPGTGSLFPVMFEVAQSLAPLFPGRFQVSEVPQSGSSSKAQPPPPKLSAQAVMFGKMPGILPAGGIQPSCGPSIQPSCGPSSSAALPASPVTPPEITGLAKDTSCGPKYVLPPRVVQRSRSPRRVLPPMWPQPSRPPPPPMYVAPPVRTLCPAPSVVLPPPMYVAPPPKQAHILQGMWPPPKAVLPPPLGAHVLPPPRFVFPPPRTVLLPKMSPSPLVLANALADAWMSSLATSKSHSK